MIKKITKRPKTIKVTYEEIKSFISKYACPSCGGIFHGFVEKNVHRFRCKCGQLLIVKNAK